MIPNFIETVEERFKDWRYRHPAVLHGLIRSLQPAVSVECGTYRGYAACYMARALQENGSGVLVCIDNFSLTDHTERYGDPVAHWEGNLAACGVRDCVTLLRGNSDTVLWPAKVDFAYIDGWHSYEVCRGDAERSMERGAECVAFDDVLTTVGPRKYFEELRADGGWDCLLLQRDGGLGIAMRRLPMRRVEFIQEINGELGTVLHGMSDEEAKTELARAALATGLEYRGLL